MRWVTFCWDGIWPIRSVSRGAVAVAGNTGAGDCPASGGMEPSRGLATEYCPALRALGDLHHERARFELLVQCVGLVLGRREVRVPACLRVRQVLRAIDPHAGPRFVIDGRGQ